MFSLILLEILLKSNKITCKFKNCEVNKSKNGFSEKIITLALKTKQIKLCSGKKSKIWLSNLF